MSDQPDEEPTGPDVIRVESLVAFRNRAPYVVIRCERPRAQMTPADARQHALLILEAADAAENDAFLTWFIEKKLHQPPEVAAGILGEFRQWRGRQAEG